ncbi:5-carboxymethyl-2-hydroxymuconate Delta-isomerase [Streptomyces brasiliensis]|uniref:Isomerase n=1 Tax=Streptomyces brasiliensis TaxID=1954 RepID=A0A917P789_9ACTN|nr:isomerase [Streptomyces brasiliensis]GGJ64722.1 isomerase [Streptomyces brasiliensis]
MPQITVDHSYGIEDFPDAFVRELHETTVEIAGAKPESCKTLFRCAILSVFGYEEPDDDEVQRHAIVHVTIGLLAGRSEETKAALTEAVLELLRKHVTPVPGARLHASAEVRELDASYRKFES